MCIKVKGFVFECEQNFIVSSSFADIIFNGPTSFGETKHKINGLAAPNQSFNEVD